MFIVVLIAGIIDRSFISLLVYSLDYPLKYKNEWMNVMNERVILYYIHFYCFYSLDLLSIIVFIPPAIDNPVYERVLIELSIDRILLII